MALNFTRLFLTDLVGDRARRLGRESIRNQEDRVRLDGMDWQQTPLTAA